MPDKEGITRPKHVRLNAFREIPRRGGNKVGNYDLGVEPKEVVSSWIDRLSSGIDNLQDLPPDEFHTSRDSRTLSAERLPSGIRASEIVVKQEQSGPGPSVKIQLKGFMGTDAVVTLCLDQPDKEGDGGKATAAIKFPYTTRGKSPDTRTRDAIKAAGAGVWAVLPEVAVAALNKRNTDRADSSAVGGGQTQVEEVEVFPVAVRKAPLSIGEIAYQDERASLKLSSATPEDSKEWNTQVATWKNTVNTGFKAIGKEHSPEPTKGGDNKRHSDEKFQVRLNSMDRTYIRLTNFAGTENSVALGFGDGVVVIAFPWAGDEDRSKVRTRDEVQRTTPGQWKRLIDFIAQKMQMHADLSAHIAQHSDTRRDPTPAINFESGYWRSRDGY